MGGRTRMGRRVGSCAYHILIYSNAKYVTSKTRGVCRRVSMLYREVSKMAIRVRGSIPRMNIVGAKYRNLYRLKPLVEVRPCSCRCIRMRPRSYGRVIREAVLRKGPMRELFCHSGGAIYPRPSSVPFLGRRAHVILRGYKGVSTRSVRRCVTIKNCRTLTGIVKDVSPRRIVSRMAGSKLHNHNNTKFPTNGG